MPLQVPIKASVIQTSPSLWLLGSSIECYRLATGEPAEPCVASWKDGDSWFILRLATSDKPNDALPSEPDVFSLVHEGGTMSAVWAVGNNAFCKVKSWTADMPLESKAIQFVQQTLPQVPVPEVIHNWVEDDRSFLLLKRAEGMTLRDAWQTMSIPQQEFILDEVVRLCNLFASVTSDRLQGVQGGPVLEPYLAHSRKDTLEPLTVCESKRYFFREDLHPNPEIGSQFHFYHPDLGPGNIMVSNNQISAIIDWEAAGFYPRFWISTKPSVSPGLDFYPPIPGVEDIEWRRRLRMKLEEQGYPRFAEWFMEWRRSRSR